ncbi:MAG: hypothetical protein NVS3B21_35400 [Acidimicrobiales bacterium]
MTSGAFDDAATEMTVAFEEPGALDRTVTHPMGDLPGRFLALMRVIDPTVHG